MTLVKFRPAPFGYFNDYNRVLPRVRRDYNEGENEITWRPRVDMREKENEFVLRAELPGLEKKDIELSFKDSVLSIKGEKVQGEKKDEDSYYVNERVFGKFERAFRFRTPVQDDKISAEFKNGILNIVVPKVPEPEPVKISVK